MRSRPAHGPARAEQRSIGTNILSSPHEPGPLRYRRLWNSLGVGFVLLVVYLSLTPTPRDLDVPRAANYGHFVAYFWLTIWFAQIHRTRARRFLLAAAFGLLGIVLEFVQGMTGYRQFDYADMVRNCVGIAIGLALACTSAQNALHYVERTLASRG